MTAARPEFDLLIACARWDAAPDDHERVRECSRAEVDWKAWLDRVRWHRLVPHARRALRDARAGVPSHVRNALDTETVVIGARALARTSQLVELMRVFAAAGVPAMPFKGPVLSRAAYGDIGVRDSVDLDVVVLPRDLDRGRAAMRDAGYESRTGMSPAQERMLQSSFGHFAYARDRDDAMVELHWRFAAPRYPWSMPADVLFARAATVELAGVSMPTPDPTDNALLQVMHGTRHQWEQIEWLVAFRELLRAPGVDADALLDRAQAHGSRRALALAMRLSRGVLDRAEPGMAGFADSGDPTSLCAATIVRAMENGETSTGQPHRFNLRLMDHAGDRVRYIARSVFAPTPREWELVRLPDALLFLYYPVRLLRVLVLRARRLVPRR